MSATSTPITPTRFADALASLPLSSLYAKHAELSNQIAHLLSSNAQLEDYAREHDDRECYEAVLENRRVVQRVEERVRLVKREVQSVRGLVWVEAGEREGGGRGEGEGEGTSGDAMATAGNTTAATNGSRSAREQGDSVVRNGGEEGEEQEQQQEAGVFL